MAFRGSGERIQRRDRGLALQMIIVIIFVPTPRLQPQDHTMTVAHPLTDSVQNRKSRPAIIQTQTRLYSEDLFSNTHELIIEHRGQEYRLRLTRNDKLILNK